jgi:hypothetical protein
VVVKGIALPCLARARCSAKPPRWGWGRDWSGVGVGASGLLHPHEAAQSPRECPLPYMHPRQGSPRAIWPLPRPQQLLQLSAITQVAAHRSNGTEGPASRNPSMSIPTAIAPSLIQGRFIASAAEIPAHSARTHMEYGCPRRHEVGVFVHPTPRIAGGGAWLSICHNTPSRQAAMVCSVLEDRPRHSALGVPVVNVLRGLRHRRARAVRAAVGGDSYVRMRWRARP